MAQFHTWLRSTCGTEPCVNCATSTVSHAFENRPGFKLPIAAMGPTTPCNRLVEVAVVAHESMPRLDLLTGKMQMDLGAA
eukprot:365478-Chlamydomonas_euryale.AAC.4